MAYEDITLERDEGVAIVTLNRPEKLNALSQPLLRELREVCDELEDDHDVRVVVLTGSGRAFSSGFDLKLKCNRRHRVRQEGCVAYAVPGAWH